MKIPPAGKRWLFRLLRLYFLYLVVLFLAQRWVIFPGQFRSASTVKAIDLAFTGGRILDLPNGQEAWWFPPRPDRPTLVVFHGNGEIMEDWWYAAITWNDDGWGVLLVEYPGYNHSRGPVSREGILACARDAIARIRPEVSGPLIGIGVSIGSGPALELAAEGHFQALILAAPYTSLMAMANRRLAPGFLVRDRFDNLASLNRFAGPLLIIHGEKDRLIPAHMGATLAQTAGPRAEWKPLPDTGHLAVPSGAALDAMNDWLGRNFPAP
jgi:uncharacterized protein